MNELLLRNIIRVKGKARAIGERQYREHPFRPLPNDRQLHLFYAIEISW